MKQNTAKLFVFFSIVIFWAYFSFPIEILQIKDHNGIPTGELAYTIEAKAYVKSYFVTLGLTLGGIVIGIILGFFIAFLRFLEIESLNFIIDEYIDIIRGTPILLQLLIFSVVIFATWSDNFYVAIIALGLNSSAYVAEIVRSGIQSIDKGQMEAARSMGLSYSTSMRMIIFPQAIKNILPSLMNEFISLFKETSIVGYISVMDVTMQSKSLQAVYYNPKPIIFTGLVYYISVKIFTLFARIIEERLNKHD